MHCVHKEALTLEQVVERMQSAQFPDLFLMVYGGGGGGSVEGLLLHHMYMCV